MTGVQLVPMTIPPNADSQTQHRGESEPANAERPPAEDVARPMHPEIDAGHPDRDGDERGPCGWSPPAPRREQRDEQREEPVGDGRRRRVPGRKGKTLCTDEVQTGWRTGSRDRAIE